MKKRKRRKRKEKLKLFLYEHVSGGGYVGEKLPLQLLPEGFAMLKSLLLDLHEAGYETIITLDKRLENTLNHLKTWKTILMNHERLKEKKFWEAVEEADGTLIIAPETNGVLAKLVRKIERKGRNHFNCSAKTIYEVSDKEKTYFKAVQMKVPTPLTIAVKQKKCLNLQSTITQIKREIKFPMLVKPHRGAGCEGVNIVRNEVELKFALKKNLKEKNKVLVQEKIEGTHASLCLLSSGKKIIALSLNKQFIDLKPPPHDSSYLGSLTPFEHPAKREAIRIAEKIARGFEGLLGFIGVDIVFSPDETYFIEINPRITTSYVALRHVININVGRTMIEAIKEKRLPSEIKYKGKYLFRKEAWALYLLSHFNL